MTDKIGPSLKRREEKEREREEGSQKVSLASLSEMTHFPAHFIKKELFLEESEISLSELREKVSLYLEKTHKKILSQE